MSSPTLTTLPPSSAGLIIVTFLHFNDQHHLLRTSAGVQTWTRECIDHMESLVVDTIGDEEANAAINMVTQSLCQTVRYNKQHRRKFMLRANKSSDQTMRVLNDTFDRCFMSDMVDMSLDFSRSTRCTDFGFSYLARLSIISLDLTGVWRLSDAGLESISHIATLQVLSIARCYRVTDQGLLHLARAGLHLLELDFSNCINVREPETLLELASHLPSLHVLKASGLASLITDIGLQAISLACNTHLHTLDVDGASMLTDDGLGLLPSTMKSLCLSRCPRLSSEALRIVANRCPALECLNLEGLHIQMMTLHHVVQECLHLSKLNLMGCVQLNDEMLVTIAKSNIVTELDMSHCVGISDVGLTALAETRLVALYVRGCHGVTSQGVLTALANSTTTLQRLRLPPTANDELLAGLHCPLLMELDCSRSENVTDVGVFMLLQSAPRLCTLRLDGCSVTDAVLCTLLTRDAKRLSKITFYGCSHMTTSGFADFQCRKHRIPEFVIDHQGTLLGCPCCSATSHHCLISGGGRGGGRRGDMYMPSELRKLQRDEDDDLLEFGYLIGLAVVEGIQLIVG